MTSGHEPSAREFLELLRRRDLLPEDVLARWEQEISRSRKPLTGRWLADRLIELDYLTPLLADRLIEELGRQGGEVRTQASSGSVAALGSQPEVGEEVSEYPGLGEEPPPSRRSGRVPVGRRSPSPPAKGTPVGPSAPRAAAPSGGVPARGPATPTAPAGPTEDIWGELESVLVPGESMETLAGEPAPVLRRRRRNVWESPLFLLGGGALLLLVILLGVLLWAVRRQSADQLLALAEEDYRSGSYTQAIAKFTDFLERFPNHPRAGMVRVHRGLARLRQAVEASSDWVESLRIAQEVLGEIAPEPAFKDEARGELIALLPRIAQELANRALARLDVQLLSKAEEALGLVTRHIAPSDRPATLLSDIEATLALARHRLAAGDRLRQTLQEIEQALGARDCAKAHQLRRDLVRDYPQLVGDPALQEVVQKTVALERELVKVEPKLLRPATSDWPAAAEHVLLACRGGGGTAAGVEGQAICALDQGVAFGLDAATGKVLWRRVVGEHLAGRGLPVAPLPVLSDQGIDFLLVDRVHQELLRLSGRTAELRWRLNLEEPPVAEPVLAGGNLWLVFGSGKLLQVEGATGESRQEITFPQSLSVPPAIDGRRRFLFQPGVHSTVFVVRASDGVCVQTVFLGHEPGAVSLPPVIVGRYLVVTVNSWPNQTDLHVFEIREEAEEPLQPVQVIRLPGRVALPPLVSGTRLFVASQGGPAWVYELTPDAAATPLREIAQGNLGPAERQLGPASKELVPRFAFFQAAQVWVADYQLSCYDVVPLRAALQPKAIRNEGSVSLQPLTVLDRYLFHIRKVLGLPDLVVSAFRVDDAQNLWETRLGVPLVTEPIVADQGNSLICVTRTGSVFRLPAGQLDKESIVDEPYITLKLPELQAPLQDAVVLAEGQVMLVMGVGSRRLPMYDPTEPVPRFRWILLPEPLGGKVAPFGAGVVVATQRGQVYWVHPRDGKLLAEPFQFPEFPKGSIEWLQPVVVDENRLLIGKKSGRVLLLELEREPKPHFRLRTETRREVPWDTPLALCGSTVWGGDPQGTLVGLEVPSLRVQSEVELGEPILWGPHSLAEEILAATASELVAITKEGKPGWRIPADKGTPTGKPLRHAGRILLAIREGWFLAVEESSGQLVHAKQLDAPLATGPILCGNRVVLGGADGCLYSVDLP